MSKKRVVITIEVDDEAVPGTAAPVSIEAPSVSADAEEFIDEEDYSISEKEK